MIFQNLFNLKQIGKYGNSDPHFVEDWIKVESSNVQLGSEFSMPNVCSFPSSAFVRIFHQKIGNVDNFQNTIIKADISWKKESGSSWTFVKPDPEQKQRFQIAISV